MDWTLTMFYSCLKKLVPQLWGKEILWLEWRNMTYIDLQGFSIQQWRRILSECEYGSNLGPRSLMWRICSRSLTLKLQPYHLSWTHCTVIGFYCITYHGDWHSHESKQRWRCRAYWDGHNWSSTCGQGLHIHQQREKFMMRGYIIPMSNVLEKDKKKIGTGSS